MTHEPEPTLNPFFNPTGVVIVGASSRPGKLGFGLALNLVQSGYTGAIQFVNPRGGRLFDRPIYPAIADVPDPVDLAVVIVAAPLVPDVLQQLGQRGIHAAIVTSGGFRETGAAGAQLEQRIAQIAREQGIRLVGPNCIGFIDTHLPLDTTFLAPPGPSAGDVAFISHSGAICAAIIDWARGQGFGFSHLISLGNQVDVRETDTLPFVAADDDTRAIALYLESLSDGREFVRVARETARRKPVIALKVGRSESGQRAAASHTGALAGQEVAYDAAFRRAGVMRADSAEEMFDWARALAWCPLPDGPNVAILTNAGGPGVMAADAVEANGLRLATLSAATRDALRGLLPADAGIGNPIDMLAAATADQYAGSLRLLLDDDAVDSVLVIIPPPPTETAGGLARALIPVIFDSDKPVVVALMGERMIQEAAEYFRAARVPEYRFPERAASALAALSRRAALLAAPLGDAMPPENIAPEDARRALAAHPADGGDLLPFDVIADMLDAYGIPLTRARLATSTAEAVTFARGAGYPVVLKIASRDIAHKSEVGGVILNLKDDDEVAAAYEAMLANVAAAMPGAVIEGVLVQHMVAGGQEVIIGALQDPQFGALVMFGSGGVEVEGLGDVAFALAPLDELEADYLLQNTWAGRRLRGFRNLPAGDRVAVLDIIRRLAQLAADFPELAEIELNPVRVLPAGAGAFAVDVRAIVNRSPSPQG